MTYSCQVCSRDGLEPELAVALSSGFRHKECPQLEDGDYWPFERHYFKKLDAECFYRDSTHDYFTGVKPIYRGRGAKKGIVGYTGIQELQIPSPSSIAKFADPDASKLMGYVERVQRGDLTEHERALLASAETLGVDTFQPDYNLLRDCKGAVGNIAHAAMECVLRGEEIGEVHPVAQGYVDGVIAFFRDLGPFETLNVEQVVYSAKHNYAGRFDARIRVPLQRHHTFELETGREVTSETWLLDAKTSSFIGKAYHNQLPAYDAAAEECGVGASDRLIILQVREDGSYTPWPCRGTRSGFYLNLSSYLDGKRLDAETKKDYRELVVA